MHKSLKQKNRDCLPLRHLLDPDRQICGASGSCLMDASILRVSTLSLTRTELSGDACNLIKYYAHEQRGEKSLQDKRHRSCALSQAADIHIYRLMTYIRFDQRILNIQHLTKISVKYPHVPEQIECLLQTSDFLVTVKGYTM